MDLITEIRSKLDLLRDHESAAGIGAAIRHIEVAERYLKRARDEGDEDLYNDVIYRTNQAFEGMLKEAYTVLTGNSGAKKTPHAIEQHFLQHELLTPRVHQLFTNYRTEWRNISTHDHQQIFKEQESLLAIVSVSAFAIILLGQIIEALSFQSEQAEVIRRQVILESQMTWASTDPLHEQLLGLLIIFGQELSASEINPAALHELEVIGRMTAFLTTLRPGLTIEREPRIGTFPPLQPDLIVSDENTKVVLEFKRAWFDFVLGSADLVHAQVLGYLHAAELNHGILFIPPSGPNQRFGVTSKTYVDEQGEATVHTVAPPSKM